MEKMTIYPAFAGDLLNDETNRAAWTALLGDLLAAARAGQ